MIFAGPDFADSLREATRSLLRARLRTLIGLTGIAIGIASVITMLSSGEIATKEARKQFEALGTDIIVITPEYGNPIALSDGLIVASAVPSIASASRSSKVRTDSFTPASQLAKGRCKASQPSLQD